MSDEQEIVVGYPADGKATVPGSILMDCRDCDVKLWFAPASMGKILEGALPLCIECAKKATRGQEVEFGGFLL